MIAHGEQRCFRSEHPVFVRIQYPRGETGGERGKGRAASRIVLGFSLAVVFHRTGQLEFAPP